MKTTIYTYYKKKNIVVKYTAWESGKEVQTRVSPRTFKKVLSGIVEVFRDDEDVMEIAK